MDYCDIEWFALETNRDHSAVFEIASKYCILESCGCHHPNGRKQKGTKEPLDEGKWEVVKQEMARVNVDIIGVSELKWTGMGEFNSDGHYIYYCGQESLRRNGVAIMVNKRV